MNGEDEKASDMRKRRLPGQSILDLIDVVGSRANKFPAGKPEKRFDLDFLKHVGNIHVSNTWESFMKSPETLKEIEDNDQMDDLFLTGDKEVGGH